MALLIECIGLSSIPRSLIAVHGNMSNKEDEVIKILILGLL